MSSKARSVIDWLVEAPHVDDGGESFMRALASHLADAGVWRISYALITKHPEVIWRTVQWEDVIIVRDQQPDWIEHAYYQRSPVARARASGETIRVPLLEGELPYPICEDLRAKGATDYFLQPLPFRNGQVSYVSHVSKRAGGFRDEDIALLEAIRPYLSLRLELESSYHGTRALLDVYLGPNAGRRVFAGEFKRGQGELIDAAIWFSDIRGFTALSDKSAPSEVIATLDRYFDAVATAIADHGGEVLKFIGDAVLAIFPLGDNPGKVARDALAAADAAFAAAPSDIEFGAALHCGGVMYGNIGARNRLDFTVISAAVNEASRLESLTKELGVRLALSERFVETAGVPDARDLGEHAVKGVRQPLRVFTR